MKQYLLSIYQPDGDPPPPEVLEPVMAGGLHPASTATVLHSKDGEMLMTDGPYVEGKEHIGGFTVIQAEDLDAALDWGRKFAKAIGLPIECRPMEYGTC